MIEDGCFIFHIVYTPLFCRLPSSLSCTSAAASCISCLVALIPFTCVASVLSNLSSSLFSSSPTLHRCSDLAQQDRISWYAWGKPVHLATLPLPGWGRSVNSIRSNVKEAFVV